MVNNNFMKRILYFLIFEGLLLTLMVLIAFAHLNKKASLSLEELLPKLDEISLIEVDDRLLTNKLYLYASPLVKRIHIHDSLVSSFYTSKIERPNGNHTLDISPTPHEENIKYYQFSLDEKSYTSKSLYGNNIGNNVSGILEDKAKGLSFNRNEEINYGFLRVTNEYVPDIIDLRKILEKPLFINKDASILIYHTHTSEGYCQEEIDKNNNSSFTSNVELSVVKPGSIIASMLENKYNIRCIHDKTIHDEGYNHNIAYDLSKDTIKKNLKEDESIKLTIDIHRDAASIGSQKFGPSVEYEEKSYAQVLFIVGSNYNNDNPNWDDNFKLAMLMTQKLEERVPGICRGISMRRDPYNENLANKAMLVEIGFNGNLIEEVVNTSELFAQVLGDIYSYQD